MFSKQAFSSIDYIYSNLQNKLSIKQAHKLQYIFINKYALENMGPKKQTEKKMLLAKGMHIADKTKRLKENLMKKDEIKNGSDNFNDDIANKQNNK